MEQATSSRGGMAIPPPVNVVELEADTALDPENPRVMKILSFSSS